MPRKGTPRLYLTLKCNLNAGDCQAAEAQLKRRRFPTPSTECLDQVTQIWDDTPEDHDLQRGIAWILLYHRNNRRSRKRHSAWPGK